jgi:hypothetical protein
MLTLSCLLEIETKTYNSEHICIARVYCLAVTLILVLAFLSAFVAFTLA